MPGPHAVIDKVKAALRRHGVAGQVVVAVSGGPDSVALLRALIAAECGLKLVVAHLNHQLRGPDSDADENFVRALAEKECNLHFRSTRTDVRGTAEHAGDNLEATARRLRYDWLIQVARESGAAWVATGHTVDDQAETVLHRLLRGAGLKGLRGIAPRRALTPGIDLIRPLLCVSRFEILDFLQSQSQQYRTDLSNQDLRHTRNRIRHELLPLLAEHYNPAIREVLARVAEQATEAYRELEADSSALLQSAEKPRAGGTIVLDRTLLLAALDPVMREALRLLWEREGWPMSEMNADRWSDLARLARGETPALDLPGGIRAQCRERVVQIRPASINREGRKAGGAMEDS